MQDNLTTLGDLTVTASNLILQSTTVAGDLTATSTAGQIQQSPDTTLNISGTSTLDAGTEQNITLANTDNDFNNVDIVNANNVQLLDGKGAIGIQGNVSGTLEVTADGTNLDGYVINNSAELSVTGLASFTVNDGESISLDNAGNDFNNVNIVNANNVRLLDGKGAIGVQGNVSGTLEVIANGTNLDGHVINNSAALNVTGLATFTVADGESINLGNADNTFLIDPTFNTANTDDTINNIVISDDTALILRGITLAGNLTASATDITFNNTTVAGDLTATSTTGQIQQAENTTLNITGTSTLDAGAEQNITLANTGNDFNNVDIVNANNVQLRDGTGAIGIQGYVSGTLEVTADGSAVPDENEDVFVITNPAALSVTGLPTFTVADGESINLGNAANTFSIDPIFNVVGETINNLVITDGSNLVLQPDLNLSGSLTASATDITFNNTSVAGNLTATSSTGQIQQSLSTTLNITGTSTLNGGNGGIALGELNDFQDTVSLTTTSADTVSQPSNVTLTDANLLNIGVSSIAGELNVRAETVTQTNDAEQGTGDGISVANTATFTVDTSNSTVDTGNSITLDNIDNQFNAITFSASTTGSTLGNVSISNTGALDLQNIKSTSLTATSLSNITQNNLSPGGALDISGLTQLIGNNITLNNLANDFTDVTITSGSTVSITDANTLNFTGASTISDSLTVNALNGNITDAASAALTVTNNTSLTTTNGNIVLDNDLHDFNSVQLSSSGDTTLSDSNSIDIRNSVINGNLLLTADTSAGGVDNDIVNTAGNITVNGASTFVSSQDGDILLARSDSNHAFAGPISASAVDGANLNNVQINNSQTTNLQNINTTNLLINSTGNITHTGAINVSALASLSSTGDINLASSANDNTINRITVSAANNVNVYNTGTLTLDAINLNGQLQVSANGITTTNDLLASTGMNLNATTGTLAINNNLTTNSGALILIADQDINQSAGATISGSAISLTSNTANINQNGIINNIAGDLTLNAAQSIVMAANASTQSTGNINYLSTLDQSLASLTSSGGGISITSTNGAIIDINANNINLNAASLMLRASNGIGSGDAIETSTAQLDVINAGIGTGKVEINNSGDVLVTNLVNNGDINFDNTSNVTLNNIDAGFIVGTLQMNVTNGSVFGVDRGIGNDFFTIADITADTAIIFVSNGEFGTFERPIVLNLNSEFFLASTISSTSFLGEPPPLNNDTSDIQFSVFDSINSVSGQQLIEVESLADIDRAIFTDLRNYDTQEISLRLPRDQIFEDDLDAYDRE